MSDWSQTFTYLRGPLDRRQSADPRSARPRLLAWVRRVRRRARLRGRRPRSRSPLRAGQPFRRDHVAEADDERGGDPAARACEGIKKFSAGRASLHPPHVLGRAHGRARCRRTRIRRVPADDLRGGAATTFPASRSPAPAWSSLCRRPRRSTPRRPASTPTTRGR